MEINISININYKFKHLKSKGIVYAINIYRQVITFIFHSRSRCNFYNYATKINI